jgi:hypothetical protein
MSHATFSADEHVELILKIESNLRNPGKLQRLDDFATTNRNHCKQICHSKVCTVPYDTMPHIIGNLICK